MSRARFLLFLSVFALACAGSFAAGRASAGLHEPGELGVARIWHGRVPTAKAGEYARYLYDAGITHMRARPSNLGIQVLRRTMGDVTDFTVISYWPSHESIAEWADKSDVTKARYLDRDKEYLLELEPNVAHYDVVVSEGRFTR